MNDDALIASLTAAVDANPADVPLRLHLGGLLIDAGRAPEAISHAALVLAREPANEPAQALMQRALSPTAPGQAAPGQAPMETAAPGEAVPETTTSAETTPKPESDETLAAFEEQLSDVLPPRFDPPTEPAPSATRPDPVPAATRPEPVRGDADRAFDVETSTIRLADVGGMTAVKERLELAFLGPLRNPELRRLFGMNLRGGLVLYGPPGCGKTFLARAVAGEMGAKFMSLSIVDVLDMWIGSSERNLHELFQTARRNTPCVLFLDEVDALGQKRSRLSSSAMRTVGNQLLAELDGVEGNNDGLFVLAATNTPWDVDPALRRPGRLDRMLLVLPPDAPARAAILELSLRDRPISGIDLPKLVAATDDFSGADLTHLCASAAEYAMADSVRSGTVRMIEQRDFDRALTQIRPSTGQWFASARNVARFANDGGAYDDLVAYLKQRKLL